MRDDRFNSLKQEFDGAPEDTSGALLSIADMMKAAYFLINTRGYKSEGEMIPMEIDFNEDSSEKKEEATQDVAESED